MEFESKGLSETEQFAQQFANVLKAGDVVLLSGDLGAGKTTFVKSVAKKLGVGSVITSPTFTIMNEYNGKFPIYHFDMYRLESSEEAEELGLSDYIKSKDGICFVEWAENVPSLFPEDAIKVAIYVIGENKRKFVVEGLDENIIF